MMLQGAGEGQENAGPGVRTRNGMAKAVCDGCDEHGIVESRLIIRPSTCGCGEVGVWNVDGRVREANEGDAYNYGRDPPERLWVTEEAI
jgi:hypothetical protein